MNIEALSTVVSNVSSATSEPVRSLVEAVSVWLDISSTVNCEALTKLVGQNISSVE